MFFFCDVEHIRRLEDEACNLARILEENEKRMESMARELEKQKKEAASREQYDKTLADRLSLIAEGLAGIFLSYVLVKLFCSSIFG